MKYYLFICLFLAFSASVNSSELILNVAKKRPEVAAISNPDYVLSRKVDIAIAASATQDPNKKTTMIGFTNFGNGNEYLAVSRTPFVHLVSPLEGKYLGGWSINKNIVFESDLINIGIQASDVIESGDSDIGCFLKNPVRYGDFDQNTQNELVILMGRGWQTDMHIFSEPLKKTIFSANLNVNHAFIPSSEDIENLYPTYGKPQNPQYLSDWVNGNPPPLENGFRSFGKIFLDDLDSDETKDIVLWRKYFVSKKIEDPIKGFEKIRDTFIHYKLIDGEYKKQPTEQAVVKGWLEAKNLTWQKGYPSKSECPGQEGQLIPEMHDPLLNDPDVLK